MPSNHLILCHPLLLPPSIFPNNLRYADDTSLMAESEEELKRLLMKMKEERKSWLKIQNSEN